MAADGRVRRAGAWAGTRIGHVGEPSPGFRSTAVRGLPGASRPVDLHRGVRAGVAARRQERLPHRRDQGSQGADRADHALSGRQFRVRVQLAGRRRAEEQAAHGARARLEFSRDEPVRHERICRLVRPDRDRAAAGIQSRDRHAGHGGCLRRVLQCGQGDEVERSAPVARLRAAAQRALLVSRQRNGWSVADGTHARPRVRAEGA